MNARVLDECRTKLSKVYKTYLSFIAILGVTVILMTFKGHSHRILPALLAGFFTWNCVEYTLHRWAFHHDSPNLPWNYLTFGLHQYHHGNAKEVDYIPVPLKLSVPIISFLIGVLSLATWDLEFVFISAIAIASNYLYFEWIHNRIHTRNPANRLEAWIHNYHLHHHYGDTHQNYGLTYPFIDLILGTSCFYTK